MAVGFWAYAFILQKGYVENGSLTATVSFCLQTSSLVYFRYPVFTQGGHICTLTNKKVKAVVGNEIGKKLACVEHDLRIIFSKL